MFESVNKLLNPVVLPKMLKVRQHFNSAKLENVEEVLLSQLHRNEIEEIIKPGLTIAITAGSRGICNYLLFLQVLVKYLLEKGAKPFIVPAMGSHGGATAEGQVELLEAYGITESSIGAPIRSSMETVVVDTINGEEVHVDKYAHEADGIILLNRVKPHTGFRAAHESGIVKMAAIGLGKQAGAQIVHSGGPANMGARVFEFGRSVIEHEKILFAIGVLENAFDETENLYVWTKPEIFEEEPIVLEKAKANLPRIFFEKLDVLIVDQIGKNISGPGMDANVTFTFIPGAPIPQDIRDKRAKRIVTLSLTKETHGSAMGIGMSDITTRRAFESIDFDATYPNCLTSGVTASGKVPMFFDSDKQAIQAAILTLSKTDGTDLRVVRIKDTLSLSEIEISEALIEEAKALDNIDILSEPKDFDFNENGNLLED
ncbi:MAG: DUF362 domain-containing protein [Clostridia bacterium]|nr:DUF362 domain-containing protein [Clostridia bacterium]